MVNQDIPDWAAGLLGRDGAERIEAAIAEAESRTSGEIVPMLVRRSSTVGHVVLLVFLILVLGVSISDLPETLTLLGGPEWVWVAGSWGLAAGLAVLLARLDFVRRAMTSRIDRIEQVERRAQLEFYENEVGQTTGDTGILLFVSLMEHRAVVLADRTIAERLAPEVWQELIDEMILEIRRGDFTKAMTQAIERSGDLLCQHFPIAGDDANELRDHLLIKE